jgi:hypothetical protein
VILLSSVVASFSLGGAELLLPLSAFAPSDIAFAIFRLKSYPILQKEHA